MRNVQPALVIISLLATGTAFNTQAQLFDKLKDKAQSLVNKADKADKQAGKATEATASSPDLGSGPSDDLVSFTNCAGLELSNIMVGEYGDYNFKRGFTNEERSGLVNRSKGQVQKGCILPSIPSNKVIYMEVDTQKYEAMGNWNDWEMQCVKSANPGAGAVGESESKSEYPYKVDYLAGKDILLHCGHSEKLADECAEGSNSSRSGAYKKQLQSRGKTMLTVLGNTSTLAPAGGEKLYCQYYNKPSGKSLFAFEYLRTRK